MPTRITFVSEIPTPYRLPLYRRLAALPELEIHVLFCSDEQPNRPWDVRTELAAVPHTILPGTGLTFGGRRNTFVYEINPTIVRELARSRPDLLVVGGYAVFAEQAAIAYARIRRIPYLLHSESQLLSPRSHLKERVKSLLLPHVIGSASAGLAVGSAAARYLARYGLARDRIRIFPNTIDVPLYRERADRARADAQSIRARHDLPDRYWLFAGRLVAAKGLDVLLDAHRRLGARALPLLVAGDGPMADDVHATEKTRLLGFRSRDELIELMALAELTIVPSLHEPWGVVVNEALAAGSPVIVSDRVGAAEDLVVDGVNGRIVAAGDADALAAALALAPPDGARAPGPIDAWGYEFAVEQFLEAVELARRRH